MYVAVAEGYFLFIKKVLSVRKITGNSMHSMCYFVILCVTVCVYINGGNE